MSLRHTRQLGDFFGLRNFGVNLVVLAPGSVSALRHAHTRQDEFIYVLSGEVVLATVQGDEILRAGDAAGFKAGDNNGHCLQNRSERDAEVLEIGTRIAGDTAFYSDIDMVAPAGGKPAAYTHRDGTRYEGGARRGP